MGYHSTLSIDGFVIHSEKIDFYPPWFCRFFSAHDRHQVRPDSEEEGMTWDTLSVDIDLARFRLNIQGLTLTAAKRAYDRWEDLSTQSSEEPPFFELTDVSKQIFEENTFEEYLGLLRRQLRISDPRRHWDDGLLSSWCSHLYHFPHEDPLLVLAALIHTAEGRTVCVTMPMEYEGDLISPPDDRDQLTVITEGKSDARYLKIAFEIIRPEYARELKFLDHDFRPPAGTGEVVRLLKSLAALGTTAPLLAILDNDTAGHLALQEARKIDLPDNFRLATYPDIELARDYPTLGPAGMQNLDVNGKACGLELYLGEDALTQGGSLSPVRWTGYEDRMGRYQGEVSHRKQVQAAFEQKLERGSGDWSGIEAILNAVVSSVA